MKGVVAGVRDYGNRMGIPTVNGAVCFDDRYLGNPLVFCGTVGLIPVDRCTKEAQPGDLIVAVGGRTGRDGIHGATFSSRELTERIGDGQRRRGADRQRHRGEEAAGRAAAGPRRGLVSRRSPIAAPAASARPSARWARRSGRRCELEKAPLKYDGLSYTEIWISESQERMVLAVPPANWPRLQRCARARTWRRRSIGSFEATGRLRLSLSGEQVADLDMHFLHDGRPPVVRQATWHASRAQRQRSAMSRPTRLEDFTDDPAQNPRPPNVCSKEWIIRQYDHEVQGGSVVKPLVGAHDDGPGDAAVVAPVLGSWRGFAVGCGINPRYGDLDPYAMAAAAIDEAVRNVVAVGADPSRIALLDNFCWGNTERPEVLGSLVRAAEACRDVALALQHAVHQRQGQPQQRVPRRRPQHRHPADAAHQRAGPRAGRAPLRDDGPEGTGQRPLFRSGRRRTRWAARTTTSSTAARAANVPRVDMELAPRLSDKLHEAICRGLVRSCHDLSEGGLAVAVAEMAFAGGVGADLTGLSKTAALPDESLLFSESQTRFHRRSDGGERGGVRGVRRRRAADAARQTCKEPRLRIAGANGEWVVWAALKDLKEAWQKPMRW